MSPRYAIALCALALVGCSGSGLPISGGVHGRVIVDGGSAGGLTVTAFGATSDEAVTEADGSYHFAHASAGRYAISASVHDTLESSRTVEAMIGPGVALPDLRFTAVGSLRGRATRGGEMKGNAGILVTVDGGDGTAVTDDGGSYRIDRVPAGTVDVTAQADGFGSGRAPGQTIRWGETTDVPDIDLVIAPGPTHLRGIARLYGATDHSGTRVVVAGTGLSATTDSDGNWTVDALPEGTFALRFTNGDYAETVPAVQTAVGGEGFIVDGGVYPLPGAPLTVYRGKRIAAGPIHVEGSEASTWISPDGAHVAYFEDDGGSDGLTLKLAAIDGSATQSVATNVVGGPAYPTPEWAPDSKSLAYVDHGYLERAPVAGGAATRLAGGVFRDVSWSPTSAGLFFLGFVPDTGQNGLVYVTTGGSSVTLAGDADPLEVWWAGDGVNVSYWTGDIESGMGNFVVVPIDGSAPLTLSGVPDWNITRTDKWALLDANQPSGQQTGDIISIELATHTTHTLATAMPSSIFQFAGDRAVFVTWGLADKGTLWTAPLDGSSAAVKVASGVNESTVSKDGSHIGFTTDCTTTGVETCKLWSVAAAGGTPTLVSAQAGYSWWAMSDDGSRLVFAGPQDATGHAPLERAVVGQTPSTIASAESFAAITSDATAVLFYPDARGTDDATLSIGFFIDDSTAVVADSVQMQTMTFAPDNAHAAFLSHDAELETVGFTGERARLLIDVPSGGAYVWTSKNALVVTHVGTPAPYRFQNGVYVFSP